jgi:hypothetical protein
MGVFLAWAPNLHYITVMKLIAAIVLGLITCGCATLFQKTKPSSANQTPVTDRIFSKAYLTEFAREICGLDDSKKDQWSKTEKNECNEKLSMTFMASLQSAYPNMSVDTVYLWCGANPIECKEHRGAELAAQDSDANERSRQEDIRSARASRAFSDAAVGFSRDMQMQRIDMDLQGIQDQLRFNRNF